jgi:hypothetical protein
MTTNTDTISDTQGNAIPQISDSVKAAAEHGTDFALILNQVENGVAAPTAILRLLAGGE